MTEELPEIHLLADATGESGSRLARAAVAQFPDQEFRLVRHRRVTSYAAMFEALVAVRERAGKPTAVFCTLADAELAAMAQAACEDMGVPCADLMSEALQALSVISHAAPAQRALRPVGVEADYFKRVSAMDFAVRNDDGAVPAAIRDCDICLVGPSRSGKTPLSIYLGYMGFKAVNVPIVPGIAPPGELFEIDKWRIVGLTMSAERLQSIRSGRVKTLGVTAMGDGYADLGRIYDELEAIEPLYRRLGARVLDTTGLALEESAARIVDMVDERAQRFGAHLRRPADATTTLPTT